MMKISYQVPIASLLSLLLGIYFIYNDGTFPIQIMFVSILVVFGFIPALINLIFSSPIETTDLNETIPKKFTTCKVIMAFTIIQFVCAGFAISAMNNRTAEVKLFCNELIVHLEQQKEQNGKYPDDIAYYLNSHTLPYRLKKSRLRYDNYGNKYKLTFYDLSGPRPRFHEYDSQKREWVPSASD